jgi:hypothetical protein
MRRVEANPTMNAASAIVCEYAACEDGGERFGQAKSAEPS